MRILIVAATAPEIQTISELGDRFPDVSFLITGAGMVPTAFGLGKHLSANRYDLVINLGIAGSFDRDIELGEIVEIIADEFAELGAEDDTRFIPIADLGFGESKYFPTASLADYAALPVLKKLSAITVNTVHGNEASISKLRERNITSIESMEGAAFFYACGQFQIPCLQIRSVSNYVEKRNRESWKIGLAIKNLNNFAMDLLTELAASEKKDV